MRRLAVEGEAEVEAMIGAAGAVDDVAGEAVGVWRVTREEDATAGTALTRFAPVWIGLTVWCFNC